MANFVKTLVPSRKTLLTMTAIAFAGFLLMPSVQAKTVIIDVRTPEEFSLNHLDGAINIPHSEIVNQIASAGVSKSDTIKLYSGKSSRAEKAKAELQSAGYNNVEVQK